MSRKEKPEDAFVERPQPETANSRSRRISLRVNEEGSIDWSAATDKQKEDFFNVIATDPDVLEKVASSLGDESEGGAGLEGPVTAEHIKKALPYYTKAESHLICMFLDKKSKGLVKLQPSQVEKFYEFSPETVEELAPLGAEALNKDIIPHLPEWLVEFFEELGPSAKFFGGLAMHSFISTQELLKWLNTQPKTVDANVATVPSAAQEPQQ